MKLRTLLLLVYAALTVSACVVQPYGVRGGYYGGYSGNYNNGYHGGHDDGHRVWH